MESPQASGSYGDQQWSLFSWAPVQSPLAPQLTPAPAEPIKSGQALTSFTPALPHEHEHLHCLCLAFYPRASLILCQRTPPNPWRLMYVPPGSTEELVQHGINASALVILPHEKFSDTFHKASQEVTTDWVQVVATSVTHWLSLLPHGSCSLGSHSHTICTQASAAGSASRRMQAKTLPVTMAT